jgi:hypothetical protein
MYGVKHLEKRKRKGKEREKKEKDKELKKGTFLFLFVATIKREIHNTAHTITVIFNYTVLIVLSDKIQHMTCQTQVRLKLFFAVVKKYF